MTSPHLLLWLLLAVAPNVLFADWKPAVEPDRRDRSSDLFYAKRTAVRPSDGRQVTAHLAFFASRAFRLEVVDLGTGPEPAYPTLGEAFRTQGCVAGVNGGFFHPDWRPSGLAISRGSRINRLETAKLLSGVVYSDGKGTHIVRRKYSVSPSPREKSTGHRRKNRVQRAPWKAPLITALPLGGSNCRYA